MTIWDLPRNDVAKAVEFYREQPKPVPESVVRVLARLQDDPTEFLKAIRQN